jgi:hypothetical protein
MIIFTIGLHKNPEVKLSWAWKLLGWVTLQEVGPYLGQYKRGPLLIS